MKLNTDDFIRLLASDRAGSAMSIGTRLAVAILAGFSISAVLFWITLGPRPDIAAAVMTPRFVAKIVESLALAGAATVLAVRMLHPGLTLRAGVILLAIAPVLLAIAVAIELAVVPPAHWQPRLVGSNSLVCMTAIPLLALAPFTLALWAARHGAPARPSLAGATIGLLAGGLAAALYAMQCTDDSPLFVAVWYDLAIAVITAMGALAGRRVLRW
jgi:hypothetical protein